MKTFTLLFKGTVARDFRILVFSVSPKLLSIPLGLFRFFFSKIRGDIRSSRCTTGVVDTGGKFAPTAPASLIPVVHLDYLRELSKKMETTLMSSLGARGKVIHEKNLRQKISRHCPFKWTVHLQSVAKMVSVDISSSWMFKKLRIFFVQTYNIAFFFKSKNGFQRFRGTYSL